MRSKAADPIAIVAVSRAGVDVARRLRATMPASRLLVPARFAAAGEEPYDAGVRAAIASAFHPGAGLVLVMAAGIAVRSIGSLLHDKMTDPAVVVVDDGGRFAISLLSGHIGGGNALAEQVAGALGGTAVITTGSEVLGVPAPDLVARAMGWTVDPCSDLTAVAAALVNADAVGVVQECGDTGWLPLPLPPQVAVYPDLRALITASPCAALVVSDREPLDLPATIKAVVYRPRTLVVGVGASRGAPADEVAELARAALAAGSLAPTSVGAVATIDLKCGEPGVEALAAAFGVPLLTYTAAELAGAPGDWARSAIVHNAVGVGGVCEPAALLAAGVTALLVSKMKSPHATVAVARAAQELSTTAAVEPSFAGSMRLGEKTGDG